MGKAVRATRKVRRSQTGQAKKLKKVRVRTTTSPTHFTFFCPQPNSSFLFDFILHFWTLFMCMQAQRMGNYKKRGAAALAQELPTWAQRRHLRLERLSRRTSPISGSATGSGLLGAADHETLTKEEKSESVV